jgi:hypothetical protein
MEQIAFNLAHKVVKIYLCQMKKALNFARFQVLCWLVIEF